MNNFTNALENFVLWQLEDILLNYPYEGEFGISLERKARVDTLQKLGTAQVYADHNPPHFHIQTGRMDLKFRLDNLQQIAGDKINAKQFKNLNHWYQNGGRTKLYQMWNGLNPCNQLDDKFKGGQL